MCICICSRGKLMKGPIEVRGFGGLSATPLKSLPSISLQNKLCPMFVAMIDLFVTFADVTFVLHWKF